MKKNLFFLFLLIFTAAVLPVTAVEVLPILEMEFFPARNLFVVQDTENKTFAADMSELSLPASEVCSFSAKTGAALQFRNGFVLTPFLMYKNKGAERRNTEPGFGQQLMYLALEGRAELADGISVNLAAGYAGEWDLMHDKVWSGFKAAAGAGISLPEIYLTARVDNSFLLSADMTNKVNRDVDQNRRQNALKTQAEFGFFNFFTKSLNGGVYTDLEWHVDWFGKNLTTTEDIDRYSSLQFALGPVIHPAEIITLQAGFALGYQGRASKSGNGSYSISDRYRFFGCEFAADLQARDNLQLKMKYQPYFAIYENSTKQKMLTHLFSFSAAWSL